MFLQFVNTHLQFPCTGKREEITSVFIFECMEYNHKYDTTLINSYRGFALFDNEPPSMGHTLVTYCRGVISSIERVSEVGFLNLNCKNLDLKTHMLFFYTN